MITSSPALTNFSIPPRALIAVSVITLGVAPCTTARYVADGSKTDGDVSEGRTGCDVVTGAIAETVEVFGETTALEGGDEVVGGVVGLQLNELKSAEAVVTVNPRAVILRMNSRRDISTTITSLENSQPNTGCFP